MKKIVLSPVKNEAWIIRDFLKNLAWADMVILADQNSTDDTCRIASEFPNVRIIRNDEEGHSNKVRWLLIDEMRSEMQRLFPNEMVLAFCLDADEIISAGALKNTIETVLNSECKDRPLHFSYPWIQLCESADRHRTDGVWKHNIRNIAFTDSLSFSERLEYPKELVINDHTERIPQREKSLPVIHIDHPVLHLHFLAKKRSEIKQAWYMCQEIIAGSRSAKRINLAYSPSIAQGTVRTAMARKDWFEGVALPPISTFESTDEIRLGEIYGMFNRHGIEKFESLNIWHLAELRREFEDRTGRRPSPDTYPRMFIALYALCPLWIKTIAKKIISLFI